MYCTKKIYFEVEAKVHEECIAKSDVDAHRISDRKGQTPSFYSLFGKHCEIMTNAYDIFYSKFHFEMQIFSAFFVSVN